MGKLHRVGLLTCTLAIGCSSSGAREVAAEKRAAAIAARKRAEESAAKRDPRFDAAGRLRPAGQRVSWVELPSGFKEQAGSTKLTASFEAPDLPLAKVTDYFEERLLPGTIELRPNGVSYRNAKPKHTQLPLPPAHVTVLEVDRAHHVVRVVVDDLTPPSEPPLREDLAARELDRERKRIE